MPFNVEDGVPLDILADDAVDKADALAAALEPQPALAVDAVDALTAALDLQPALALDADDALTATLELRPRFCRNATRG